MKTGRAGYFKRMEVLLLWCKEERSVTSRNTQRKCAWRADYMPGALLSIISPSLPKKPVRSVLSASSPSMAASDVWPGTLDFRAADSNNL